MIFLFYMLHKKIDCNASMKIKKLIKNVKIARIS